MLDLLFNERLMTEPNFIPQHNLPPNIVIYPVACPLVGVDWNPVIFYLKNQKNEWN